MLKKIVLIGAGGFGREVASIIEVLNKHKPTYELLGFLDDGEHYNEGMIINGYPWLGDHNWIIEHKDEVVCTCCIGNPKIKKKVQEDLTKNGVVFETIIAYGGFGYIGPYTQIGNGCVLYGGVTIAVNCKIGNGVVMNQMVNIGHDCVIGDYTTTFIQGDRSNMLRLWVVGLVTAYTIHKREMGWKNSKETNRILIKIILSILAIGAIFFCFKEIVGRTSDLGPLDYVTFYAGSPIAVLNQIWEEEIVTPEVFGQRTFFYLNQSLTAVIGWPGAYNFYYPFFTSANGTFIGNAPSAFRPVFTELGLVGFIIVMMLFSVFFTLLYCRCRKQRGDSTIDIHLLIYAYVSYVFFMYFYSTFFDFLSHVFIKYIIELILIRWLLVDWKINIRFIIPYR